MPSARFPDQPEHVRVRRSDVPLLLKLLLLYVLTLATAVIVFKLVLAPTLCAETASTPGYCPTSQVATP